MEKLSPGAEAYVQAALLYTTTDGQRRIRVHTLALPISVSSCVVATGAAISGLVMP